VSIDVETLQTKSVAELREYFLARKRPVPDIILEALANDSRSGVRQLAQQVRKRRLQNHREGQRLSRLLRFERELRSEGFRHIAGVDEAGMAPLAGPVVAAAVILPYDYKLEGLNDSKKIPNGKKREDLAFQIKRDSIAWSTGRAEVEEIDFLNIYRSGLLAMSRAIEHLPTKPEYVLVDARTIPHCPFPQKAIVHGDELSASIAAASIIAKTTRDSIMVGLDRMYSGYGFASHKGYPTRAHLRILADKGPLPVHRRSFAPVRRALGLDPIQCKLFPKKQIEYNT
jgi:ribonuclease HII